MGNIPLFFTLFSFLLWEYYFLGSCLTIAICCMNSREAMWFQPGLVVFGERRWGIGSEFARSIQRCFLFLRRGWAPARPAVPAGRTLPTSWEEGYLFFLLFMLSVSREEVFLSRRGLRRKPSLHIPRRPRLSPLSLAHPLPTPTYALLLLSTFPPKHFS